MSKDRRSPRETDLSRVRTVPIAVRPNKVRAEEFAAGARNLNRFSAVVHFRERHLRGYFASRAFQFAKAHRH